MDDCVHVYGVLLVGVLSKGVAWLMWVFFLTKPLPPPLRRGNKKNTKTKKKYMHSNTLVTLIHWHLFFILLLHAGSFCILHGVSFLLAAPFWAESAFKAAPVKINVFSCFQARKSISSPWLTHIGLRDCDSIFRAYNTCAFL